MPLPKRRSAVFLLAMFVAGGLLSPVVHPFQHAQEERAAIPAAAPCEHAQHSAHIEVGSAVYDGDWCLLCVRTLVALSERAGEAELLPPRAPLALQASPRFHTAALALPPTRGPPFLL